MIRKWTGKETRALREASRLSVRDFAALLGAGVRTVASWEAGGEHINPRPVWQEALDTSLARVDPTVRARFELLLAPSSRAARAISAVPFDPMKRRTIVRWGATSAGIGATLPSVTLELARHGLTMAAADEHAGAAVEEWQQILADYGRSYMVTPADHLLDMLTVDLQAMEQSMNRERDGVLQDLCRVAAGLCVLTAMTLGNMGQLVEAARWWRSSRRMADRSGDPTTIVWVRGYEVVRALYDERPLDHIIDLADEAEAFGGSAGPAALPEVLAGKAQALAIQGRGAQAETTLRRLRTVFAALPDSVTKDSQSVLAWGEPELRFVESFVYSYLGDIPRAEAAQDAALRRYPATNSRGSAQIGLMRALCLVRSGDGATGVDHARTVMSGLADAHFIRPVVGLAHQVLNALPQQDQRLSATREFRRYLTSPRFQEADG